MARVDDFLNLVDDPSRRTLELEDSADAALLALMVHIAFSDGVVAPNELAFLTKVMPGRSEESLLQWVQEEMRTSLDWSQIQEALSTTDERWKGLRFACRMAWKDGSIQKEEREILEALVTELQLGSDALERVLAELRVQTSGSVSRDHLVATIKGSQWGALQVAGGPIQSDLKKVVSADMAPIARLGVNEQEVAVIFQDGFAAKFLEGDCYIPWTEFVAYTRVATLGASLQIHTESGRTWSLVDTRLRGFSVFFDRLFKTPQVEKRPSAPVIRQTRGLDAD